MIRPDQNLKVYLCKEPVDMRKQMNGLAVLVESELELNPFDPALFVFCNRQKDKIKILFWERNGFVVWYKRLESERFKWPKSFSDTGILTLTSQELNWLLDGYDLSVMQPHKTLYYQSVG